MKATLPIYLYLFSHQLHQDGRRTENEADEAEKDNGEPVVSGDEPSIQAQDMIDQESGARPKLILNIMSGSNDEKSVVTRHEELVGVEAHDQLYDESTASPVVLRHPPRVPPLHCKYLIYSCIM